MDPSLRTRRDNSQLPRAVWLLGWVSLATDAATELVYPLLPFFLTRVLHAGAVSSGRHRRGSRGDQQPAEDLGRSRGRSVAAQTTAGPARLQHLFAGPPLHRVDDHVDAGVHGAGARPGRQRRPRRAARRDARELGDADDAREDIRLSPRDGSHRRHHRPDARLGVPVLLPGSVPASVCVSRSFPERSRSR